MNKLPIDEENLSSRFVEYSDQLLNFQSNNYDDLIATAFSIFSRLLGFTHFFYSDSTHLFELNDGKLIKLPWEETQSLVDGSIKKQVFAYQKKEYAIWLIHPPQDKTEEYFERVTKLFQLKLEQLLRGKEELVQHDRCDVIQSTENPQENVLSAGNDILAGEKEEIRMLREWNRRLEQNTSFQDLFLSKIIQDEIGSLSIVIGLQGILKSISEQDISTQKHFLNTILHHLRGRRNFLELIDLTQQLKQGILEFKTTKFNISTAIHQSINRFFEFNSQQDVRITISNKIENINLEGNAYFLIKYLSMVYHFNRLLFETTPMDEDLALEIKVSKTSQNICISITQSFSDITDRLKTFIQPLKDLMDTISEEYSNILLSNVCLHRSVSLLNGRFEILSDEKQKQLICCLTLHT